MEDYRKIVEDFIVNSWKSQPFERMLKIKEETPADLLPFLKLCLAEIPKGGTFFDAALSFINEDEFRELVDCSINLTRQGDWTEVMCSVIDYASLQFPLLLLEYLPELLGSRSNSYYDKWVWRKSGSKEESLLIKILESGDGKCKHEAWECLVNIRNESAILKALDFFEIGCPGPDICFDIYSRESGFEVKKGIARQLYPDGSYHIIFNNEYLDEQDKSILNSVNYSALSRKNHPTWTFKDSGGKSCRVALGFPLPLGKGITTQQRSLSGR